MQNHNFSGKFHLFTFLLYEKYSKSSKLTKKHLNWLRNCRFGIQLTVNYNLKNFSFIVNLHISWSAHFLTYTFLDLHISSSTHFLICTFLDLHIYWSVHFLIYTLLDLHISWSTHFLIIHISWTISSRVEGSFFSDMSGTNPRKLKKKSRLFHRKISSRVEVLKLKGL